MEEFIAGAIGGGCGLLVGHPLEVIKVQQQLTGSGLQQAAAATSGRGVRRGIFRGLSFPLASFTLTNAIFFGCYSNCLQLLQEARVCSHECSIFIAGMAGGAAQLPLLAPIELVKTAMQAQISNRYSNNGQRFYSGPIDCAKAIVRRHGYSGLFKGFGILLARDVPSYGLYMLTYDLLYHRLSASYSDTIGQLLAGGVAGSVCWLSIMPIDVLKSNIQAEAVIANGSSSSSTAASVQSAISRIYTNAGLSGFFRGSGTVAIRAFPVNAVTFFAWSRSLEAMKG